MTQGHQIKQARFIKGMTQQELAVATKTNVRTIQRIENDEVIARAYTLKLIAEILDFELDARFFEGGSDGKSDSKKENKALLVVLHLSGFLLLPAFLIWKFEKDKYCGIREHGIDIINFQLTMLVFLIPVLPIAFLPLLIALFITFIILFNTIKVMNNKPYHYPWTISFLR